jgi:MFS family permease
MRRSELMPSPRSAREKGQLRAGFRYVRGRPDIVLILVIVGMIGTFGFNFQMTTALMATETFGKGASEYGLLGSIMAIGSLTGALLAARRDRPRLRLVIGAAIAFGVFATIACLMPTYTLFAIALVPVGVSSLTLMTAANATVQLSVAPEMRGRVLALYMAVFMGGTPIGAPIIGWIGEVLGARWTIGVGGVVAILTAVGCLVYLVRSQDLTVRYSLRATPHLQVWTPSGIRREEDRQREELREAIAAHQAADTKSAA